MKAIILISSIFYILGLKISNKIDLVKRTSPVEKVIMHTVKPAVQEDAIHLKEIESEKEADELAELRDKLLAVNAARDLIQDIDVAYEVPGIIELEGEWWKLKADIVNNTQGYVIDLKTTSDIDKFGYSAKVYNYDSQAYIYSTYFKMDFVFIVICKKSKKIGIFDCSPQFLESGKDKVQRAVEQYRLFYKDENFDATQYFISKTL